MIFASDIPSAVSREECERLSELATGKVVLEIGSEFGRSTIALASTARIVHAVDWHRGDQMSGFKDSLPAFLANLERYGVREKVVPIIAKFHQVEGYLRDTCYDIAFIDAEHTEEAVFADARQASFLVRESGLLVFHDVDQPQVGRAVQRFCATYPAAVEYVHSIGTLVEARLPSLDWRLRSMPRALA